MIWLFSLKKKNNRRLRFNWKHDKSEEMADLDRFRAISVIKYGKNDFFIFRGIERA